MEKPKKWILRNLIFLGLISFFADVSSEMVYPLIPLYLTTVFGATPALIGIIEGIAESLASLMKVFSGAVSDRYGHKKLQAFLGYSTGLLYKLALLFAGSWTGILLARVIDRFGKGIRTAPRDVMIADSASADKMGLSYGIHKALDMAGSAVGILAAYFLLTGIGNQAYKTVFLLSIIPAAVALALFLFVKENKRKRRHEAGKRFFQNMRGLNQNLKLYLAVAFVFSLSNSSNTFLLLRAYDMGFSSTDVILLYFLYNLTTAVFAIPLGRRSDRIGRKKVLVGGYLLYSAVYFGFAFATARWMIVAAFAAYGLYTAMVAGMERAFIAEIAPPELRGTMLGLHATLIGVALLPASAIAGLLWNTLGTFAPFTLGAALSLLAAAMLGFFFHPGRRPEAPGPGGGIAPGAVTQSAAG